MRTRTASIDAVRVKLTYEAASGRGKPPTQAVADEFGVNIRTAGRYVRAARDAGELPATSPGLVTRPTHSPATAVIWPRSATRRQQWQVCETCLTVWPCPGHRGST